MSNKLDLVDAYRAYAVILDQGERCNDTHTLDGLSAVTEFDGYTVTLSNGVVSARLMFHSKVQIDAPSSRALGRFVRQVTDLAARSREADEEPRHESAVTLARFSYG